MDSNLIVGGHFWADHYGCDGKMIRTYRAKNGITTVALNHVLDVAMRQQSQLTWKIGLIDNSGFDELAAADTMASHAGWTEVTAYTQANRPLWSPGAAASKKIINNTSVQFTMSSNQSINGIFVTSDNTKGGATGTLFCTGSFDSVASMLSGETLKIFYRLAIEGR